MAQAPITTHGTADDDGDGSRKSAGASAKHAAGATRRARRRRQLTRHGGDPCTLCGGKRVQVDAEGRCSLGHQVLSRSEVAARLLALEALEAERVEQEQTAVIDLTETSPPASPLPPTAPSFSSTSPAFDAVVGGGRRAAADPAGVGSAGPSEDPLGTMGALKALLDNLSTITAAPAEPAAPEEPEEPAAAEEPAEVPAAAPSPAPAAQVPLPIMEDLPPLPVQLPEVSGAAATETAATDAATATPVRGIPEPLGASALTRPIAGIDGPLTATAHATIHLDDLTPDAPSLLDLPEDALAPASDEPESTVEADEREPDQEEVDATDGLPRRTVAAWIIVSILVASLLVGAWVLATSG